MKNTKEIRTILACLYYINKFGNNDENISNLLDYAFDRIFNTSTRLLFINCLAFKKERGMEEVENLLREDTQYYKFIEKKELLKYETL